VVSPEMPTGRSVGQPVLYNQSHRQRNDAVSVVAARRSQVRRVDVEVVIALAAVMLGVVELNVSWSFRDQIAHIMQRSLPGAMSVATPTARGTWSSRVIAAPSDRFGLRKVFDPRDSFGTICDIFSRSRHGNPP